MTKKGEGMRERGIELQARHLVTEIAQEMTKRLDLEDSVHTAIEAITLSHQQGREEGLRRAVEVTGNLRIVAILDQHEVSDEDAQYAGEIHNQSVDKIIEAITKEMEAL